jgi:hypothetical protein
MVVMNHYFQSGNGIGNTSEQRLHEDLIIEGLKIYGNLVYYLPRTLVNKDIILGEDVASRFNMALPVEMYFETTEGFLGQQEIINKFGLEIREDTTFMVSKRRFQELVSARTNLIAPGRPNEGDILYLPLMNSFFEILFVEDQQPFFQLGNLPVYKLKVTRWEYSNEQLATGVTIIDEKEQAYSINQLDNRFTLETSLTVNVFVNQLAESLLLESGTLDITNNSSAYLLLETANENIISPYADNFEFDTEAGFSTTTTTDDLLDFSEMNPFGEPGGVF